MKKDVFAVPEVAKICKVSRQTVHHWIKNSYLKAFRPAKNADWKVTRNELVRYMKEHEIPPEFLRGDKTKILIVDDEEIVTKTLEKAFQNVVWFSVETANSGFSAGVKLESFNPDVVVLDIYLSDMDGREFFKHIKEHPELRGIKVIGISGKMSDDEIITLRDQGFCAFLQKPFKTEKLIEIITKLIEE